MRLPTTILAALALAGADPALAQNAAPDPHQFGPGLRSVKIESQDWAKSVAFYTALGMKAGTKRDTTQDLVWEGPTQNSGIQITTTAYAQRARLVRGATFLMMMAPDVGAVVARLRAAGFADVPEARQMGSLATMVMLQDPDGNRIELLGPAAGK